MGYMYFKYILIHVKFIVQYQMFTGLIHIIALYAYTLVVWCVGATTATIIAKNQEKPVRFSRIKVPKSMIPN